MLDIIEDTKESATLRSAEFYLDAVENSIAMSMLKDTKITDGTYKIMSNGSLCSGDIIDNKCSVPEISVEVSGEVPTSGTVTITSGNIAGVRLEFKGTKPIENKNGKLDFVKTNTDFTPIYYIGESITFDPGNGEKMWNVIDEDKDTVTLMLSENLGDSIAWNADAKDNNYGPITALTKLNELTKDWDNVDPIGIYTYINNLNGTTVPNGYQKLEIKDGKIKLTHKDGEQITEVEGISKARILTKEEVFEIAQKTNTNLTEENLRAYIERNLSTANTGLGTSLTDIDEAIEFPTQLEGFEWTQYESKYFQTYFTVIGMISKYGIETTYDALLPDYLYQNLYSDKEPYAYWILSSRADDFIYAWYVAYDGGVDGNYVGSGFHDGVRPVITVLKSNL